MTKVFILYIGTGAYSRFWPAFHQGAERYLFPGVSRAYHVATDDPRLLTSTSFEHAHFHYESHKPWPLPTLLRYGIFLQRRSDIEREAPNLILFFNANARFLRPISLDELSPDSGQDFVGVEHPGYVGLHPWLCPHERRPNLSCHMPWSHRAEYLQGCLIGGRAKPFLDMCLLLHQAVLFDQKNQLIARWHDESYWNWFCSTRPVRRLSSVYAFPWHPDYGEPPADSRILMELKPNLRPQRKHHPCVQTTGRMVRDFISKCFWRIAP